jgi:Domain of unknown function (DUF1707)
MTNQYVWARFAGPDPNLRAADADRERIAERLRKSHAEGRLDIDEFQQRLQRCFEAKTLGELSELVTDLPREDEHGERRPLGGPWRWRLTPLVAILIGLLVVSAASEHHFFWLWIPLVFLFWKMSWWRRRRWSPGARRGPGAWI